jgi:glycosyltransferase involved in cell wall biosynthesis
VRNGSEHAESKGLVLHVIPSAIGRGAQLFSRALVDLLDEPGRPQQLMSIFSGDSGIEVDISLGEPGGAAAAAGFDPRVALRLRRFCADRSPDLLVAHGGDSLKYLVAGWPRVPIVYYAIGTVAPSVHTPPRRQIWRRMVGRAEVIAAVSEDVADECRTLLDVPPRKLKVVPNGRDASRFRPSVPPQGVVGLVPPMMLFVGHLTAGKRPDDFIELVRVLRAQGVELRAAMVGDGPMRGALEGPARAAGVDLLGTRADVDELMRGADLFVFPSLPEGEGMPGVLIEAGLSGLCVLATDVPGVSAVIENGVTGSIVSVSDFGSQVEEARRLLSDPVRRDEMGRAARKRCVSLYSMEASASLWRELLKGVPLPGEHGLMLKTKRR